MTSARVLVVLLSLALASAAVVTLASRVPASVRRAGPAFYDLEPGQSRATFTDAQVARHGSYRGPLYLALALGTLLQIALLLSLRGAPIAAIVRAFERVPGGRFVHAAAVAAAIAIVAWIVAVPLAFVRGHVIQKAWGLSTQDTVAWLVDQLKGLGISVVIAAIAGGVFFAVVRWQPGSWWLWMSAAFSALSVLMVLLFPVVIAPLFNRFSPLEDEGLKQRIVDLAERSNVSIDDVLVADASRRSTAENAYVAGLGPTKQVVVYDTLLEDADEDEVLFVVAHELAHRAERHVVKQLLVSITGLVAGFALLWWSIARGPLLRWAGVQSLDDLRVMPMLLLFAVVAGLVAMPVQSAVSRSFEASADRRALDVVDDPEPAARAFRRLAIANIADLRPPRPLVWLLYSHPPIVERIRAAEARLASKP
ncbi:MAG TPA: M48 family metallopeptidase [Actinomycetota bacterium]|nr:M48 family metallopeptidase [Actinomycetota bacterium]